MAKIPTPNTLPKQHSSNANRIHLRRKCVLNPQGCAAIPISSQNLCHRICPNRPTSVCKFPELTRVLLGHGSLLEECGHSQAAWTPHTAQPLLEYKTVGCLVSLLCYYYLAIRSCLLFSIHSISLLSIKSSISQSLQLTLDSIDS